MLHHTIHSRSARRAILVLCGAMALLVAAMGSQAVAKDRNDDGISDRWEKRHDLSLKVDQASRDQDSDEMPNLGEFEGGTVPRDEDTDGDGVPDGDENAGEVASFTPGVEEGTGTLVINLYSGEALTGEVTEHTRIAVLSAQDEEALARAARPGPEPPADAESEAVSEGPGGIGQHDCPGATEGGVEDLVPGAVVHQASLDVTADGKEFRRIELAPSA